MDIDAAVKAVAARHNMVLDRNDPAFVLVTLNELMLKDMLGQLRTPAASRPEFTKALLRVDELIARVESEHRNAMVYRWILAGILAGAALFCAGFVLGMGVRILPLSWLTP